MSKVKFYRDTEVNVPTGLAHAGKVYYTDQKNLYVIDAAGNKQKFSDVVFAANQAAISAITTKLQRKIYVAITEKTMWFWDGTTLQQLGGSGGGGGTGDVVGPASAITQRVATFDGTSGKIIRDGGRTIAEILDRANHTGTQDASSISGTKTASFISDFAATVRATVITGFTVGSNATLAATDTILAAFGKLQAQINYAIGLAYSALTSADVLDEDDMASDSNTKIPTQQSVKAYVDNTVTAIGAGDMDKATYDTDDDGVVNNSALLQGNNGAHYLNRANHTGTQDAASVTGTKTASFISDFAATVRSTVLTGLSTATNAAIAAADSVLVALGKLQAQVTAKQDTLVSGTNIKTINGNSLLGSGDLTISGGGSPAGSNSDIQFNSAGAFAADAELEWDNTNKRFKVGPHTSFDYKAEILGNANTTSVNGAQGILIGSFVSSVKRGIVIGTDSGATGFIQGKDGTNPYLIKLNPFGGDVQINNSLNIGFNGGPSHRLHIRGASTASTASALHVENSAATQIFQIRNNGQAFFGGTTLEASALFALNSTTLGFLPPRMTTTQKNAISSPAAGLVVYDTTLNKLCVFTTAWETVTSA
jgi:hypothetical protein